MGTPAEAGIWQPKGLIAVLDTSTLVRAWLARPGRPSTARDVMRLAGVAFGSFTSPAILEEFEAVLARPRFGTTRDQVRLWLDVFLRATWRLTDTEIRAYKSIWRDAKLIDVERDTFARKFTVQPAVVAYMFAVPTRVFDLFRVDPPCDDAALAESGATKPD